ncbi:MAG: PQQ-binding-like beta-propeller repeat protein [Deltaproteobacteria bacterium]|jgi:hypothetical protein
MRRHLFLIFILISTFAIVGCKITGKITENGKGLEGITVTLSGDASMSTTTDVDGTYVFNQIKPGNYEVKPADDKHTFEPANKKVKVGPKNKIAQADFELVTSPPPASLSPWSTYQGNAAHTGYVPVFLNTNEFFHSWTKNIAEVADLDIESIALNPVAAGDGKVFVTTGGDYGPYLAMAFYSLNGEPVWSDGPYNFEDVDYIGPPAYANGIVYIQSVGSFQSGYGYAPSFLWALDASSGEIKFDPAPYDNQGGRFYAPAVYVDDVDDDIGDDVDDYEYIDVYVASGYYDENSNYSGGVYGFDGVSGERLWRFDLNEYDQWTPAVNENYVIAYTGWYEPQLTVIDRTTGKEKLYIRDPHFDLNGISERSMDLAPVLSGLNNVIAIQSGRLINFDLADEDEDGIGDIKWEKDGGFSGQPSLAEGIIFAVYDGDLYALDESDGSFIDEWKPWQAPQGESIVTPMIVTDNLIFASTESATYALDLEKQKEQWSYPAGGHLALSDEGVLFIATADGNLVAISTMAIE